MAKAAGYDVVVITQRHLGSADAATPYCGSGGYPAEAASFPTICTTHAGLHAMFGQERARLAGGEDRAGQLVEKGRFIDEGGSNLCGVQVFEHAGKEVRRGHRPRPRPLHVPLHRELTPNTQQARASSSSAGPGRRRLPHPSQGISP